MLHCAAVPAGTHGNLNLAWGWSGFGELSVHGTGLRSLPWGSPGAVGAESQVGLFQTRTEKAVSAAGITQPVVAVTTKG